MVLDLAITKSKKFLEYAESIPAQIGRHQGKLIAKGAAPEKIEESWLPDRLVILAFATKKNAKELFKHRTRSSNLASVNGMLLMGFDHGY